MPKSKRASTSNRRSQSRAAEWEQLGRELAEHKKAGEALRARAQALGRRDPNDPNDRPEKDTHVPIEDLVEGAAITGPAAGRPKLTIWWSEDKVPEFMKLQFRALHHFAQLGSYDPETQLFYNTRKSAIEEFFRAHRLSNGKSVGVTKAGFLAMFCLPVDRLDGGPEPTKPTKK